MEITKEIALQRWQKLIADKKRVEKDMDEWLASRMSKKVVTA